MHVMLVEDDLELGHALLCVLQREGFTVEWFRRAKDGERGLNDSFCAVLLDIKLPDGCGLALLNRWRHQGLGVPVLMMTAKADLDTRLKGLNDGADDYIVKPFAPVEMVARLRAILRRSVGQANAVWHLGGLAIDPSAHSVELHGQPVKLSPSEFELLLTLAQTAGSVVSKSRLLQTLSPWGALSNPGAIDVHIFNMRKKLGADRIQTVRGIGYVLVK